MLAGSNELKDRGILRKKVLIKYDSALFFGQTAEIGAEFNFIIEIRTPPSFEWDWEPYFAHLLCPASYLDGKEK